MYVIHSKLMGYVKRFNGKYCTVLFTSLADAKKFKTEQKARDFIAHYADLGYGLNSPTMTIEKCP